MRARDVSKPLPEGASPPPAPAPAAQPAKARRKGERAGWASGPRPRRTLGQEGDGNAGS